MVPRDKHNQYQSFSCSFTNKRLIKYDKLLKKRGNNSWNNSSIHTKSEIYLNVKEIIAYIVLTTQRGSKLPRTIEIGACGRTRDKIRGLSRDLPPSWAIRYLRNSF